MIEYFRKMALKYNIPLESVISIALNRYGIIASDIEDNRIRFYLKMLNSNNSTFFCSMRKYIFRFTIYYEG